MNDICYIGKHFAMGYGLSTYINHITNCKNCQKRRQAIMTVKRLKKAVVRTYTILSSRKIRFYQKREKMKPDKRYDFKTRQEYDKQVGKDLITVWYNNEVELTLEQVWQEQTKRKDPITQKSYQLTLNFEICQDGKN